jgi:ribonuclease R
MNSIGREAVMRILRDGAPRALHAHEVSGRLRVPKRERDRVKDLLDELVHLGLARELPGGRYRAADAPTRRRDSGFGRGPAAVGLPRGGAQPVRGRITTHPRGFAFVAAEDGGADVFIPPDSLGPAMHGDYVEVQTRSTRKGREGQVVQVLGRGLVCMTGTVRVAGREVQLEPDDGRLRGPLPVRGKVPREATPDQAVLAEVVRYPKDADDPPVVRVVRVLGPHGSTRVEVAKILIREAIVEPFSDEALAEAESLPDEVTAAEKAEREDLRHLDLVTIDPEDARDHDDAVYSERLPDGGWRVIIAIADVSHYVQGGTTLDREAFARGCSIYLPDRVIPMLPPKLSTDLASLVPNKDRLCLAVDIELGPSGAVRKRRFVEGLMRSGGHLTYPGVARALGWSEDGDRQAECEDRRDMLQALAELAKVLRRRRLKRGALDLDLPEAKIVMAPEGDEPVDVKRTRKDPGIRRAYQLVEECMLLANEVVAESLTSQGVPTLYRIHGQPDDDKIEIFSQVATSLGHPIDPEAATKPRELAQFMRRLEGSPHLQVLSYLLLRAMQQAVYDPHNIGHFGLGASDYLHFTSPIRRYPDMVVHRIVRKVVRGEGIDPLNARPELRRAGTEASRLERRAMSVERDVVDLFRTVLMKDRIGEEFEGTISGVAEHGFYTRFDEPFVESLSPVERLEEDHFQLDDLGIRLVGKRTQRTYALGDRIRVRIVDISIARRDIITVPASLPDEPAGGLEAAGARGRRKGGERKAKGGPGRGSPERKGKRGSGRGSPERKGKPRAGKDTPDREGKPRRGRRKRSGPRNG